MKKADIELDLSTELILVIIGLVIILILIGAIIINLETIGDYLMELVGEVF